MIQVHHPITKELLITSSNPRKVVRTIETVNRLRADGVELHHSTSQSEGASKLRAYCGAFCRVDGPVYWTLAARLLGAN